MPDEFQPVRIKQNRGPTLHFQGKLLASTEWEARDSEMRLEIWQAPSGALIPVTRTKFESGRELVSASVVDPLQPELAQHCAVMDHFDWTNYARSMVRSLGWSLKREIT